MWRSFLSQAHSSCPHLRTFRNFIEKVKVRSDRKDENCISVVLTTVGGSAATTE
ncbi:MAG: hypothetical protein OXC62_03200 [Aestuariivita sp.]|nr:hypothetical protein [Aestuariivita sp.]